VPRTQDRAWQVMRHSLTFDVTDAVESGEQLTQAAWLFLPERPVDAAGVLLCLAGGTYDKHYWHIDIDGYPGYSFGEHLAGSGFVVIAVDHLAIGESADPTALGPVGLELLARGDAEVARQVRERLRRGELHKDLPPMSAPLIGVGHSMGACLATMVQATTHPYDAVVLLGAFTDFEYERWDSFRELAPHGIGVVTVHPGITRTEATSEAAAQRPAANLAGRMIDAREVAYVVTFLASPKSAAVNGDAIAAGGGVPGAIYY